MFSRRSIILGLGFLASNPLVFLYNAAIIMLTISVTLAFKRRYFALITVSFIWIALGITNSILLSFRTTPLGAIDFQIFNSVDSIISMYLNITEIVLIFAAVLSVVVGLIIAWIKAPKNKPKYLTTIIVVLGIVLFISSLNSFLVKEQVFSSDFGNLADAYNNYGFAYCFTRGFIDRGVKKPDDFSEERINLILKDIYADETTVPDIKPNIIMVQLESFFDVNYLEGLRFSENPIPVFAKLKESYPHGFLTVPSIGAGTANTEFEVLTGMSLRYFGAGEYPYKTVLQKNTCESIGFNLKELGYTNHAIHNHQGSFYKRHIVFPNLGFDTFTSLEYMNGVEFNPIGWAKDGVLTDEIMKALAYTAGPDFIYAISVQGHGKYPGEVIDETQQITIRGIEVEKELNAFEYFVNQLKEMDAFIDELIIELSEYEEPVALVLFGDHLPSLNIEDADLSNKNRFEMEYVIWSNFDLGAANQDLATYQLSAHVLKHLGISNGILTKLHQTYSDHENYQAALELLEYDMISGEQIVYGGESPHVATELQMGISDIIVTSVHRQEDKAFVIGDGFTEWSQIILNDKKVDTIYIDGNTLMVLEWIEPGTSVVVAQIGNNAVLSQTNSFNVHE